MTTATILAEILKLSVEERLQLVDEIWDTIAVESLPVPESQIRELRRRLSEHDRDPSSAISWEEMHRELLDEP